VARTGKMARQPVNTTGRGARRRRRRRGSYALIYIFIVILIMATGITLSLTVFFNIETIVAEVLTPHTDGEKYSPEEIAAASGIVLGENIFRLDTGAVRDRLLAEFPYIETVRVRRRLPYEARIDVTLHTPAAALSAGDEYLLITREGKVLERGMVFIPENVPVVKGVYAGDVKPGERLKMNREEEARAEARVKQIESALSEPDGKYADSDRASLLEEQQNLERGVQRSKSVSEAMIMLDYLFKAMDETGFTEITNVDVTDSYNMKIIFENRLLLNLGTESDLPAKLTFLKEMIDNQIPSDAEGLINATNIERRSVVLAYMPIEDAIEGRPGNRVNRFYRGEDSDKPEDEPDEDPGSETEDTPPAENSE